MKLCVGILMLLCLSLLGACSTKRALTKTETLYLAPNAGLLLYCPQPKLSPSRTNADIIGNSLKRQTAYDTCNIYHTCLIEWHKAAKAVAESKGKEVPVPEICGYLIK